MLSVLQCLSIRYTDCSGASRCKPRRCTPVPSAGPAGLTGVPSSSASCTVCIVATYPQHRDYTAAGRAGGPQKAPQPPHPRRPPPCAQRSLATRTALCTYILSSENDAHPQVPPRRSLRITRRAAGLSSSSASIVEHHVERWSMPQHIVVGFFVSELLLLWLRMRPQDRSASGCLHWLDRRRSGRPSSNGEVRGRGLPWLLGQRLASVAWFGTLLLVCVRECEQSFRTCVPYVRSREHLK